MAVENDTRSAEGSLWKCSAAKVLIKSQHYCYKIPAEELVI